MNFVMIFLNLQTINYSAENDPDSDRHYNCFPQIASLSANHESILPFESQTTKKLKILID